MPTCPGAPMTFSGMAMIGASAAMINPAVPTTGRPAFLIFASAPMVVTAVGMIVPGPATIDFVLPHTFPAPAMKGFTPDLKELAPPLTRFTPRTTRTPAPPTRNAPIPTGKTVSQVVAAPGQVGSQALTADSGNGKSCLVKRCSGPWEGRVPPRTTSLGRMRRGWNRALPHRSRVSVPASSKRVATPCRNVCRHTFARARGQGRRASCRELLPLPAGSWGEDADKLVDSTGQERKLPHEATKK